MGKLIHLVFGMLLIQYCRFEEENENFAENEENDEAMTDTISDIDSTEFVASLEKHLSDIGKDELSHAEAVNYLLVVYSESSMDDIQKLEAKLKTDGEKLDEEEENILYFKGHLEEFFTKKFDQ